MNKKQARLLARKIVAQQAWNAMDGLDVGELDDLKTYADVDRLREALEELRDNLMKPVWAAEEKSVRTN